jgi:AraC-like DNA-binding protein
MAAGGWIVRAPGDIERAEACFSGTAFAPHRHDTYAVGITLGGVQSFDYRGAARHSLKSHVVVIHPDELHDGRAGDERAFRYRVAYLAPSAIQTVLGGSALPFIEGGVSCDPRLRGAVSMLLGDCERALAPLEVDDALYEVATALLDASAAPAPVRIANGRAVMLAKAYIDARLSVGVSLGELERATGHDRWQLSRDFRAVLGTSPYRYLTLRRLDRARRLMTDGASLAACASATGFSDQSHFNRAFKAAVGMTPMAWLKALAHNRSIPAGEPVLN